MTTYTFKDGHKCTSNLNADEVINRMNRLSWQEKGHCLGVLFLCRVLPTK